MNENAPTFPTPKAAPERTVPDMLAAIGWVSKGLDENGNEYASDLDTGAVRISNGWGPEWTPAGYFACGSRGPRGRWPTFDETVAAAYRHHVLGEPEAAPEVQGGGDCDGGSGSLLAYRAAPWDEDCDGDTAPTRAEADDRVLAFLIQSAIDEADDTADALDIWRGLDSVEKAALNAYAQHGARMIVDPGPETPAALIALLRGAR